MSLKVTRWPQGGAAIEHGPVVYALPVAAQWRRDMASTNSTEAFPAWNAWPASSWNYALDVDENTLESDIEIERRGNGDAFWWYGQEHVPVVLHVPVRRIEGWELERKTELVETNTNADNVQAHREVYKGDFQFTPSLPDYSGLHRQLGERETATFVPFGATRLRMTVLPDARKGDPNKTD